jgi:hypothetical protein
MMLRCRCLSMCKIHQTATRQETWVSCPVSGPVSSLICSYLSEEVTPTRSDDIYAHQHDLYKLLLIIYSSIAYTQMVGPWLLAISYCTYHLAFRCEPSMWHAPWLYGKLAEHQFAHSHLSIYYICVCACLGWGGWACWCSSGHCCL